jgi:FkbM family methyltransferase
MAMIHTDMPKGELELFASLGDIQVVFDVGARADVEYVRLKPDIELHAFEPNDEFFAQLKEKLGDRPNTYLNNYGLGDREDVVGYDRNSQSFLDGEANPGRGEVAFPIKTLDGYCAEQGIERIDFLKIDTEGYDFKVLQGGTETIKLCRYIQYEHWNDRLEFHTLLAEDFYMTYIGDRNVFCQRK